MALSAPTIEACGKNKTVNWLLLVLPDISKTKTENGQTYQLKRAFIVRAQVHHRKQPGQPLDPVIVGRHVIARYTKTTVPKLGTLLLDSKKTNLRDGTYAYAAVAHYVNPSDPDDLNWEVSLLSEVVAF